MQFIVAVLSDSKAYSRRRSNCTTKWRVRRDAPLQSDLKLAAEWIAQAEALLIGAGAGLGVDSGLPDFRGPEGFWKAYPPFRGRSFAEMSNPRWFHSDPQLAWGFFGHRLHLYRSATPHAGYDILRRWVAAKPYGGFVFTSNVDGHFLRAGFQADQVVERHGSIHFLQCLAGCRDEIWPADDVQVEVDPATMRATTALPKCSRCGALARPNVLMFDDWDWNPARTAAQLAHYGTWLNSLGRRQTVAIELGAGAAIPTVRMECAQRAAHVVRINPRDHDRPARGVALPLGALSALTQLADLVR